jgi:S1-C subfamily serine protease
MERRIVLRHVTGAKAPQTETFALSGLDELTFGRESACDVKYDTSQDDLVSRRHMKVVRTRRDPPEFSIVDLGSRNGTFVNRKRVVGSTRLQPGDLVRLGVSGPEFTFELEEPAAAVEPAAPEPAFPRETVVSELRPARRRRTRKHVLAAAIVMALAAGGLAAFRYWPRIASFPKLVTLPRISPPRLTLPRISLAGLPWLATHARPLTPTDIERASMDSVASIQVAWRLVETGSGRQLRQVYIPNESPGQNGAAKPLVPGAGSELPVFVLMENGRLEPMLTPDASRASQPIGGTSRGTGFVVNQAGLILTNRAVAAAWASDYQWPEGERAGVVAVLDKALKIAQTALISRRQFPRWTPKDAEFILEDSSGKRRTVAVDGVNDSVEVRFGNSGLSMPARLARISGRADLATIQVAPDRTPKALTIEQGDDPKPGDPVVLLAGSKGLSTGKVRKLAHGDAFELSASPTVAGNLGAPVFDAKGRVVAIETAGDPMEPSKIFAIPIRYGMEMTGT